ncbi:MAG TPA: hypothetical protein VF153_02225 [Candidatus Limnocylindria bacterium]
MVATVFVAGPAAAATPGTGSLTQAITGTINGTPFSGTIDITRFASRHGDLLAIGTVADTGTAIDGQRVVMEVTQATGSCEILDLTLGPLDLNLLGLAVHLDQVHLNITAESGPGNLLGNLLCAVAHLLDNSGGNPLSNLLNQIAGLLNQILAILG